MKKTKGLLILLLALSLLIMSVGCYAVSGQEMDDVKGTYKLTRYTRINKYERKEGYTPKTINYIEDEEYKYEDYLIVTGNNKGYYVHKDAKNSAYAKEVTLTYEYDQEDSSNVEYVIFNDALTVNETSGVNRLGVSGKALNYSKPAFDYTELITKRPMRSEDISVRWEKVDDATDLSYAESKLGNIKVYDYHGFAARGIYSFGNAIETSTGNVIDSEYHYCYYVIDTAKNVNTVKIYYALKDAPTEHLTKNATISRNGEDWSAVTIDGTAWSLESPNTHYYYREADGHKYILTRVSNDISDESLDYYLAQYLSENQ